jgi:hypothetical protein
VASSGPKSLPTQEIAFESFGVRVAIAAPEEWELDYVRAILPPGWQPCPPDDVHKRFTIELDQLDRSVIRRDGKKVTEAGLGPNHALFVLESQVRSFVALNSPDHIFVHAGVVAIDERLLVLPGFSFSGKTTLVTSLVRAGATYYSDEYALIDPDGLVHPYPRRLSLRDKDFSRTDVHVADLGGVAGDKALPISRILVTTYDPSAEWNPRKLSSGECAMALLSHTVAARSRPEQVMYHLRRAVEGAVGYESPRGESEELAKRLVSELSGD